MKDFWARLSLALALAGQVLAAALSLEVVGGEIQLPAAFLKIQGREFVIAVKVNRIV